MKIRPWFTVHRLAHIPSEADAAQDLLDPASRPAIHHLPLSQPTPLKGASGYSLSAAVNGTARIHESYAVLEILVSLQVHNILKHRQGIPALLKAVSQTHKLGQRKATNFSYLTYGTGIGGASQGQVQNDPRLEQLIRELLAIGHVYVTQVASSVSLAEAGWLREDAASVNPLAIQLLKVVTTGGESWPSGQGRKTLSLGWSLRRLTRIRSRKKSCSHSDLRVRRSLTSSNSRLRWQSWKCSFLEWLCHRSWQLQWRRSGQSTQNSPGSNRDGRWKNPARWGGLGMLETTWSKTHRFFVGCAAMKLCGGLSLLVAGHIQLMHGWVARSLERIRKKKVAWGINWGLCLWAGHASMDAWACTSPCYAKRLWWNFSPFP